MKLSVILPARNEEVLIEKTLNEIYRYSKKGNLSFEILVIVNGSSDRTEEKTRKISRRYPEIKILKSKPGYGFALRKGLGKAAGDYIATFNVDFYDFRLIDLTEKDMGGADMIVGSKLAKGSKDSRPFLRKMVSVMFNLYLRLMYGFRGTDTHGIKLIRRKVIKTVLPSCQTDTGIFDTEFVLKAQRKGFVISEIPVAVKEKRPSRFVGRLFQTPKDIYSLYKSLN